jgi:NhaP-type Na+/H+ or K+/H+ antiporter
MVNFGAAAFGLVIGWVTYRTLRRSSDATGLSDIATVSAQSGAER